MNYIDDKEKVSVWRGDRRGLPQHETRATPRPPLPLTAQHHPWDLGFTSKTLRKALPTTCAHTEGEQWEQVSLALDLKEAQTFLAHRGPDAVTHPHTLYSLHVSSNYYLLDIFL